jgi:hypothetical protein
MMKKKVECKKLLIWISMFSKELNAFITLGIYTMQQDT